jgi:hypothetical protein
MRFTNDAAAATTEAHDGVIRGLRGPQFSAVLLDGPADPLPATSRPRMTALENRLDGVRAITRDLNYKKQALIEQRQLWSVRLNQLKGGDGNRPVGDSHPAVREAHTKLQAAEREMEALQARIDDAAAARNMVSSLVRRCHEYNGSLSPELKLEVAKVSVPKLAKGETALEAIERIRHQLAELRADRAETVAAPIPSTTAKAIMRRQISELAERGRPNVDTLIETAGDIGWATMPRGSVYIGFAQSQDGTRSPVISDQDERRPDGFAMLAWLHQAALMKALEAEIDQASDDGAGLTDETRKKKLEQIDQRRLELEYVEVLLIESANGAVDYRADTDPRALLQVAGPAPREP